MILCVPHRETPWLCLRRARHRSEAGISLSSGLVGPISEKSSTCSHFSRYVTGGFDGAVDVAGTMLGVVERQRLLPTDTIAPGHKLIGLASSGLHTNGYSLARKVFSGMDLSEPLPGGTGESIGEALLAVHRSYLRPLGSALDSGLADGLAHLTGGGFIDNIPRILPAGCGATIDPSAWKRPVLFNYLIARAGLDEVGAHQIFNCGIGLVAVVAPDLVDAFQAAVPEETWLLGEVTIGKGVTLV